MATGQVGGFAGLSLTRGSLAAVGGAFVGVVQYFVVRSFQRSNSITDPNTLGKAALGTVVVVFGTLLCICGTFAVLRIRYWGAFGLLAATIEAAALGIVKSVAHGLTWHSRSNLITFAFILAITMGLVGFRAPIKSSR